MKSIYSRSRFIHRSWLTNNFRLEWLHLCLQLLIFVPYVIFGCTNRSKVTLSKIVQAQRCDGETDSELHVIRSLHRILQSNYQTEVKDQCRQARRTHISSYYYEMMMKLVFPSPSNNTSTNHPFWGSQVINWKNSPTHAIWSRVNPQKRPKKRLRNIDIHHHLTLMSELFPRLQQQLHICMDENYFTD